MICQITNFFSRLVNYNKLNFKIKINYLVSILALTNQQMEMWKAHSIYSSYLGMWMLMVFPMDYIFYVLLVALDYLMIPNPMFFSKLHTPFCSLFSFNTIYFFFFFISEMIFFKNVI